MSQFGSWRQPDGAPEPAAPSRPREPLAHRCRPDFLSGRPVDPAQGKAA